MPKPTDSDVLVVDVDELLNDPDTIPYVQVTDDDGKVIEERPATKEELKELLGGK